WPPWLPVPCWWSRRCWTAMHAWRTSEAKWVRRGTSKSAWGDRTRCASKRHSSSAASRGLCRSRCSTGWPASGKAEQASQRFNMAVPVGRMPPLGYLESTALRQPSRYLATHSSTVGEEDEPNGKSCVLERAQDAEGDDGEPEQDINAAVFVQSEDERIRIVGVEAAHVHCVAVTPALGGRHQSSP